MLQFYQKSLFHSIFLIMFHELSLPTFLNEILSVFDFDILILIKVL